MPRPTAPLLMVPWLLLLAGCATGTTGSARRASARPNVQAAVRSAPAAPAPSAKLPRVDTSTLSLKRFPDGTEVPLSSFRGRVVLLDVWATWCEPCVEAMPAYRDLERRYAERGLTFLALSLDEDPRQIERFLEAQQLGGLNLFVDGPDQPVASALALRGVPTTYLLDRSGRLRHVHEGFVPEELPQLVGVLEALLDEGR